MIQVIRVDGDESLLEDISNIKKSQDSILPIGKSKDVSLGHSIPP